MKTQILKTWLVMFVVLLMMGGLTRADSAGMEEVFFDDFDDGNFDGWSATHPTTGDPATPPDVVPSPEGYSLRGVGSGYSHDPGLNVHLSHPLVLSNVGELKFEMRAKSGPQWPNQAKVHLFNGYDYYSGTAYGEGNQTAWFRSGINGVEYDHVYSINANVWHNFAWMRDTDGWWSLSIDDLIEAPNFYQDNQLTSFDQVVLHILRNQSEIEWVRISGVREAVPVEWRVADGGNGHYYERVDVPEGIVWPAARTEAEYRFFNGSQGYLATITSGAENQFIFDNLIAADTNPASMKYFIGGFLDGSWQWVTAEEWSYTNWWVTEPSGDGTALEIASSLAEPESKWGTWNDEPYINMRGGYIVEYSVPEPTVPEMVLIPGGEFEMGDHHGDRPPLESKELPVHAVFLNSFFMSKYEITNQQYCDYLNSSILAGDIKVDDGIVYDFNDTGYNYPYCDTHSADTDSQIDYSGGVFRVGTKGGRDMSDDPMVEVSWYGAAAYCNWRSSEDGKESCYNLSTWECDFTQDGYRLPTEAEWEYAARGGNHSPYYRFPWGDTISHSQANYVSYWVGGSPYYPGDVSPTEGYHPDWEGIYPYTSVVGNFAANGYGLYDMAGNVWEWCNDWWDPDYYDVSPYDNPQGPASGSYRVRRGGGWVNPTDHSRVAERTYFGPDRRMEECGFRVVRKPEPPTTYHVDAVHGSDANDGLSEFTPFATITKGIETASDGDTVLVWPGVYTEEVRFRKKAVTVRSAADAALIQNPDDFAVSFYYGEGRGSILKNFVIANSLTGIFIAASSPTISNVTVVNNAFGIEAYADAEPDISNSILWNNEISDIYGCEARQSWVQKEPIPEAPPDGLISHWTFDEGEGDTAYDTAGSNHGTLVNGPQWTSGQIYGALSFYGDGDHVVIPDDDSLTPSDEISVSYWINKVEGKGAGIYKMAFCPWGLASPGNSIAYRLNISPDTGYMEFQIFESVSQWDTIQSNAMPSLNVWHHIVGTFSHGAAVIYIDGQLDASETLSVSSIMNDVQPLIIAGMWDYCGRSPQFITGLHGFIDDIRIYDRALSSEEVEQLYQSTTENDPLFADAEYGDYHLKSERGRYWPEHDIWVLDEVTSSCIDAGDPDADFSAERNPNGGRINIGAYGGSYYASMSRWWPFGDVNHDGVVDWKDFAIVADTWLESAPIPPDRPTPPAPASTPDPYNGADGISTTPVLSWQPGYGATSHDIYFGTTPPGVFQDNQAGASFATGPLKNSTAYYWQIVEVNTDGKTPGPIWTFTTTGGGGTTGR